LTSELPIAVAAEMGSGAQWCLWIVNFETGSAAWPYITMMMMLRPLADS